MITDDNMGSYAQFILFGDSLLEFSSLIIDGFCLAAALQSHYLRRLDIVNRGFSGYTSAQALGVLPKIVPNPSCGHVEFLLILFGANDASVPDAPTEQHVPIQEYKNNLRALITHDSVRAHQPKIILATPPPIDEVRQEGIDASKGYPLCRRASTTSEYAEAVRQIGKEIGGDVVVLDLWSTVMEEAINRAPNQQLDGVMLGTKQLGTSEHLTHLLPDGLHFGGAGYTLFFRALINIIEVKWPGPYPYVFPEWRVAPRHKLESR